MTTSPSDSLHARTKIIATLGPASRGKAKIQELFDAGADVFRINFSHGTHEDHAQAVADIRAVEKKSKRPICIIADLQGPKLRIGTFEEGEVELTIGQKIRFDLDSAPGNKTRVNLPHPEILKILKKLKKTDYQRNKLKNRQMNNWTNEQMNK